MAFDIEIRTKFESFEKKLKWTINDVHKSLISNVLESPPFSLSPDSSALIIQINFQKVGVFKIFFKKCDAKNTNSNIVEISGKVVFKDPTSSSSYTKQGTDINTLDGVSSFVSCNTSFREFLIELLGYQVDDLIIECHLTITTCTNGNTFGKSNELNEWIASSDEVKTVTEKMFKSNAYTDVTFSFGEKAVRAHKAVLAVTSPVFENMFKHDTSEKQTNTVSITDVDIDVFKSFLEYLYTNKINENIQTDLDSMLALYEVSDKYEITELQMICANILLSSFLNVETIWEILKLADLHSDASMKDILFKFLKENFSEVAKTKEWASLTSENVKLASEVVGFITHQIN